MNRFIRGGAVVLCALVYAPISSGALCKNPAEDHFLKLYEKRKADPGSVDGAAYRQAARAYLDESEACYEANRPRSYRSSSTEEQPRAPLDYFDEGGVWFGATTHEKSLDSGDYTIFGTKWGEGTSYGTVPPGLPGGTVTYSYMATGTEIAGLESQDGTFPPDQVTSIQNLPGYSACFETEMQTAFAVWSAVANIEFVKVQDNGVVFNGEGAAGDIRIGAHTFDGQSGMLEHAFFPPPNGRTAAGDIHFDLHEKWACQPTTIDQIDFGIVAIHAVGHSIGLSHEFINPAIMQPFYSPSNGTLTHDDVSGAVAIYGPLQEVSDLPSVTDLSADLMWTGWPVVAKGDTVHLGVRVSNLGETESGSFGLRFFLSADDQIGYGDTSINWVSFENLSPGSHTDTIELSYAPTTAGRQFIGACIDYPYDSQQRNDCSAPVAFDVAEAQTSQEVKMSIFSAGELSGDSSANSELGEAVSVSGKWMAIGAPGEKTVMMYRESEAGWVLDQQVSGDSSGYDFGSVVLVSGDTLFVGDRSDMGGASFSGAVYCYRLSGGVWTLVQTIQAPSSVVFQYFGSSIDYLPAQNLLVVGAPSTTGQGTGRVYLYSQRDGIWAYQKMLQAPGGIEGNRFGVSVSANVDWIAVGSMETVGGHTESGAVHIFTRDGNYLRSLYSPYPEDGEHYGTAVDIDHGLLLVGASSKDFLYPNSGIAYLYTTSNWLLQHTFYPNPAANPSGFGQDVKIASPSTVFVVSAGNPGGIYPFYLDNGMWMAERPLLGKDPTAYGGYSLDTDGITLVMGVGSDSTKEHSAGSAYIYEMSMKSATYRLTVDTGAGGVLINGIYCEGLCIHEGGYAESVTLVPSPSEGDLFTGWTGACSGSGACRIMLSSDVNVALQFSPKSNTCRNLVSDLYLTGLTNEQRCELVHQYQSGGCIEFSRVTIDDNALVQISAPRIVFGSGVQIRPGTTLKAEASAPTWDGTLTQRMIEQCHP